MLKILGAATLLAFASASLAQTAQPGQTTPNVAPSQTPYVTPSQTPAVTPSQTPSVTPSTGAPIVGGPAPTVGGIEQRPLTGLSRCENLLAFERDKCLQDERNAATGATTTTPGATTTTPGATTTAPDATTTAPAAAPMSTPSAPMTSPGAPTTSAPGAPPR